MKHIYYHSLPGKHRAALIQKYFLFQKEENKKISIQNQNHHYKQKQKAP